MMFVENDSKIPELYNMISCMKPLPKQYATIFVYNEENLIEDEEHSSECITSIEKDMITDSFRKSIQFVYAINGEDSFIDMLPKIKKMHTYVMVYSMAQNIIGAGRRSLIPLLCDYYKLINIGSDFLSSTLSGNKELMYKLITPYVNSNIPSTIYVNNSTNLKEILERLTHGIYILKPNDESASIGVKKIKFSVSNAENILKQLMDYQRKYSQFCIQEYIDGPEIEIPLLFYEKEYYCPGCVEIINSNLSGYLDYDTVKMDDYTFREYNNRLSAEIINCSKKVAKALNFKTICRIDFRIKDDIPYIIDIGANPTISFHSSTNYIFRNQFNDESAVYRLLLFIGLIKAGLFKPPFDKTK